MNGSAISDDAQPTTHPHVPLRDTTPRTSGDLVRGPRVPVSPGSRRTMNNNGQNLTDRAPTLSCPQPVTGRSFARPYSDLTGHAIRAGSARSSQSRALPGPGTASEMRRWTGDDLLAARRDGWERGPRAARRSPPNRTVRLTNDQNRRPARHRGSSDVGAMIRLPVRRWGTPDQESDV
jgi:hypothetical protein